MHLSFREYLNEKLLAMFRLAVKLQELTLGYGKTGYLKYSLRANTNIIRYKDQQVQSVWANSSCVL
jgi:hypothetical protein